MIPSFHLKGDGVTLVADRTFYVDATYNPFGDITATNSIRLVADDRGNVHIPDHVKPGQLVNVTYHSEFSPYQTKGQKRAEQEASKPPAQNYLKLRKSKW